MLLLINIRTTLYRLFHLLHTALFYYPKFLSTDFKLLCHYFWKSPYKLTKEYGETPLWTLDRMATEFGILSHHRLVELGCGTARTCFWLKRFIGCSVVGVDNSEALIQRARLVGSSVELRCEDMLKTELDGDFIYFYGTSFADDFIDKLAKRFDSQKVITVSFALSDYDSRYRVEKRIRGSFPWGRTEIYLNCRADGQDPVPCAEAARVHHSTS
ncbi:MAG: hypothetical protein S4CHLAM81_03640 [Chlamydiales bacterium]|nr:hypothetical protein [Chlamydiales bacterium]MCH9635153.1 hypothetical protein [Chlamydiales bacterium]MCH9703274.1 class I SAM-dependent methyltransferase [Chlamydiota bacterium]